jgi:hypothetical protein
MSILFVFFFQSNSETRLFDLKSKVQHTKRYMLKDNTISKSEDCLESLEESLSSFWSCCKQYSNDMYCSLMKSVCEKQDEYADMFGGEDALRNMCDAACDYQKYSWCASKSEDCLDYLYESENSFWSCCQHYSNDQNCNIMEEACENQEEYADMFGSEDILRDFCEIACNNQKYSWCGLSSAVIAGIIISVVICIGIIVLIIICCIRCMKKRENQSQWTHGNFT